MADAPRIFSGIRASGDKTLGNYSGGYRQYVATQDEGEAFFCIVDLHSITTDFQPEELREYTLAGAAMLSRPGSTPIAPPSSRRATSSPTPRPPGCSAPSRASGSCGG